LGIELNLTCPPPLIMLRQLSLLIDTSLPMSLSPKKSFTLLTLKHGISRLFF
jgi:hypothetical protein